jgi:hypothetical protein
VRCEAISKFILLSKQTGRIRRRNRKKKEAKSFRCFKCSRSLNLRMTRTKMYKCFNKIRTENVRSGSYFLSQILFSFKIPLCLISCFKRCIDNSACGWLLPHQNQPCNTPILFLNFQNIMISGIYREAGDTSWSMLHP